MKPEDKAAELITHFSKSVYHNCSEGLTQEQAKQSAIICVDEILKSRPSKISETAVRLEDIDFVFLLPNTDYWQQVKQSIINYKI